jgi:hypothetical protein
MPTPSGQPAWTRQAAHTDYGGNANKSNYASQGVVDPLTDVGASDICAIARDLTAVSRTADFAEVTYTHNDASPAAPTVHAAYLMTGVRTTNYAGDAAPTGFPAGARQANGHARFTFSSSYLDDYGISGAFGIQHAEASVHGSTACFATCDIVSATVVDVRVFLHDGTASLDKKVTLRVS